LTDASRSGTATTTNGAVAVRLAHVTKTFGSGVAVRDLNLELAAGEFFALLGPSGCGKTTTLRMIGGFEQPTSGQIFLGGEEITWTPPYRRDVNTVFQSYALFPHLNVFENVAFGLRRKKMAKPAVRKLVEEHLELLGLGGFGPRPATKLSGGQQQRVALARALVNQPRVLLLDEPMGALDAKIRKSMQIELKRIQREVGITFLYVTHDQDEAMALGDRLAVMRSGRYEDLGTPQRVYDQPATQFVAEFLGACNLLDINNDHGQLRLPDGSPVVVDLNGGSAPPSFHRLGVRPEKMVIEVGGVANGQPNHVSATVRTVTYLGARSEYELATTWGGQVKVVTHNVDSNNRPQLGDNVVCSWGAHHSFFLPDGDGSGPSTDDVTATTP
jgi:spermidine/putrescine transport system ATP-binding protein